MVEPLAVALIVTAVVLLTRDVDTTNVARVDPAGTWTLDGTVATLVLLLLSVTSTPAALDTLTVAVALRPPVTVLGLKESDVGVGAGALALAAIVIGAEVDALPRLSVTVSVAA